MRHADVLKAHTDVQYAAKLAHVIYQPDNVPGWTRTRKRKAFTYQTAEGKHVPHKAEERIHALRIPPAWKDVWISPSQRTHIQATGLDSKGRKQYLYHARWSEFRGALKYTRLAAFADVLPKLRRDIAHALALPGLPREKVAAAALELIDELAIRVGNDAYAAENKTYGVTTLRDRHLSIDGDTITLQFVGKSHKQHELELEDKKLAALLREEQKLPGTRLFQYEDAEGARHDLTSSDVNAFMHDSTEGEFTAKDFRTWIGTVYAYQLLCTACTKESISWTEKQYQKSLRGVLTDVAQKLGNTLAVTKAHYVHADLQRIYCSGKLQAVLKRVRRAKPRGGLSRKESEATALLIILGKEAQNEKK